MANIRAVIIRRREEENTVAIVTAEVEYGRIATANQLRDAIRRAVCRWAQEGPGRALKEDNGGDINIGDLAAEGVDPALAAELRKEGVIGFLPIFTYSGEATSWDFDDNLAEEMEAE